MIRARPFLCCLIIALLISACDPNATPEAEAGPDRTVSVGTEVALDGSSSSDPNGDPLSYGWELRTRPSASDAQLEGATSATATFLADVAGTYEATLSVSDGRSSSSDQVTIVAEPAGSAPGDFELLVDEEAEPTVGAPPPFQDGRPRPVAAMLSEQGDAYNFVSNELTVVTNDDDAVADFVARWNGEILKVFDPADAGFEDLPKRHLVRIDTILADIDIAEQALLDHTVEGVYGTHRITSEQGLALLTAAATERTGGVPIGINWLGSSEQDPAATFNDYTSAEGAAADFGGYSSNAFDWPHLRAGGNQDVGTTHGWIALERLDALVPSVTLGFIDAGFAPNADFPSSRVFTSLVDGDTIGSTNPDRCSGNARCDYHGTGVVSVAAARTDDGFGVAGVAGPVVDRIIMVHLALSNESIYQAIAFAGSRADIVNMSFSARSPEWFVGFQDATDIEVLIRAATSNGTLFLAAAGNGGDDLIGDNVDYSEAFGETMLHYPCELDNVICVGALGNDSSHNASYSNFGSSSEEERTVDIYAPGTNYTGPDPDNTEVRRINGTSGATPYTAGVAALIWAADDTRDNLEKVLFVLNTLFDHAQPSSTSSRVNASHGYVDAFAAVRAALGVDLPARFEIESPSEGTSYGGNDDIEFTATIDDLDTDTSREAIQWSYTPFSGGSEVLDESTSGETITANPFDPYCTFTATIWGEVLNYQNYDGTTLLDSSTIDLRGLPTEPLSVQITAPPRHVHYLELAFDGTWYVPDYELRGTVYKRRCGSDGLDGNQLEWRDEVGRAVGAGSSYALTDADFDDGSGGHFGRTITLLYASDTEVDADAAELVPCYGRVSNSERRPGYPPCPDEVDSFWYDPSEAFETLAEAPTREEADRLASGIYERLLEDLGITPGEFPQDGSLLIPALDLGPSGKAYLTDLLDLLQESTLPEFQEGLADLESRLAIDEAVTNTSREVVAAAVGIVEDAYEFFAPTADGGQNGWARLAFVEQNDVASTEVRASAPAKGALEGFLTSYATNYDVQHPNNYRLSTYGAVLMSLEELEAVGY